jgi:hypothetical protein
MVQPGEQRPLVQTRAVGDPLQGLIPRGLAAWRGVRPSGDDAVGPHCSGTPGVGCACQDRKGWLRARLVGILRASALTSASAHLHQTPRAVGQYSRALRVRSHPPEGEENRFLLHESMPEDMACGLMPCWLGLTRLRGTADACPPVTVREMGTIIHCHDDRPHRRIYEDTGPGGHD